MITEPEDYNLLPYTIDDAESSNTFPDFIDEQEKACLLKIFGSPLFAAFEAGIAVGPIDQRWKDITDGCEYTYCGKKYKWGGLPDALRPFVYSKWLEDNQTFNSNNGTSEAKVENSTRVEASRLVVKGWNDFATRVQGRVCEPFVDSLYGMLKANHLTYEDIAVAAGYSNFLWYMCDRVKMPGYKNTFNI